MNYHKTLSKGCRSIHFKIAQYAHACTLTMAHVIYLMNKVKTSESATNIYNDFAGSRTSLHPLYTRTQNNCKQNTYFFIFLNATSFVHILEINFKRVQCIPWQLKTSIRTACLFQLNQNKSNSEKHCCLQFSKEQNKDYIEEIYSNRIQLNLSKSKIP